MNKRIKKKKSKNKYIIFDFTNKIENTSIESVLCETIQKAIGVEIYEKDTINYDQLFDYMTDPFLYNKFNFIYINYIDENKDLASFIFDVCNDAKTYWKRFNKIKYLDSDIYNVLFLGETVPTIQRTVKFKIIKNKTK